MCTVSNSQSVALRLMLFIVTNHVDSKIVGFARDCQPHKLVLTIHGIRIEAERVMNPKCESDTEPCQYNGRFGIEFTFGDQRTSECPRRKGWDAEGRPIGLRVADCWE